jgi:two-component system KDP operon response regulator KdpE
MSDLLVVEDDDQLRKALALTLRARGHGVHAVATGAEALERVAAGRLDAVLLDLGLPDLDGVAVIAAIRERSGVPIVVLSARRDQSDKVTALDAGADDYLTKPFGIEELLARLRAAQRRAGGPVEGGGVVRTPDFSVDLGRKQVTLADGSAVHLTPTEWGVLETLVRADGLLVGGADLLREVWGPQYETQTNYLRVYLAQLRRKLEPDQGRPRYLLTTPGLGYRFDATGSGS